MSNSPTKTEELKQATGHWQPHGVGKPPNKEPTSDGSLRKFMEPCKSVYARINHKNIKKRRLWYKTVIEFRSPNEWNFDSILVGRLVILRSRENATGENIVEHDKRHILVQFDWPWTKIKGSFRGHSITWHALCLGNVASHDDSLYWTPIIKTKLLRKFSNPSWHLSSSDPLEVNLSLRNQKWRISCLEMR